MMRLLLLVSLVVLVACEGSDVPDLSALTYDAYGAAITTEEAVSAETLVERAETHDGAAVKVTGIVREVCRNKGCWLALDAGGEADVRVSFKDYGFFVPTDIDGRRVVLAGTLHREEVSVETLRHFAEDAGASPDEIAAIQTPEQQLSIIADGVLVAQPG